MCLDEAVMDVDVDVVEMEVGVEDVVEVEASSSLKEGDLEDIEAAATVRVSSDVEEVVDKAAEGVVVVVVVVVFVVVFVFVFGLKG